MTVLAPIPSIPQITAQPVDYSLIMAAGKPDVPQRAMVANALQLVGTPYVHRGRVIRDDGGDITKDTRGADWLGVVKDCVSGALGVNPDTLDDFEGYSADWTKGPGCDATALLFSKWGLTEIPAAAAWAEDVLLFAMPTAHAAVLVADDHGEPGRMVLSYWGRGCVESWLGDYWKRRLDGRAFTLRAA